MKLRAVGVVSGTAPWSVATKGMNAIGRRYRTLASWTPLWALRCWMEWELRRERKAKQKAERKKHEEKLKGAPRLLLGGKYLDRVEQVDSEKLKELVRKESFRQGARGNAEELKLVTRSWGFDLEDIRVQKMKLWNGTEDVNTPIWGAREMARRLPHAVLTELQGANHFTPWDGREVLKFLLDR